VCVVLITHYTMYDAHGMKYCVRGAYGKAMLYTWRCVCVVLITHDRTHDAHGNETLCT